MKGARLATRAARVERNDIASLSLRLREVGTMFGKLGIILLISVFNSIFWVGSTVLVCRVAGTEVSAYSLTVVGLVIMTLSVVGLALLMHERR